MLKRAVSTLLVVLALFLTSCASTPTSGLVPFADSKDGYRFLYPNGWTETKGNSAIDILFHDIIEPSENVSVAISKLETVKNLEEIGEVDAIGLRVQQRVVAPDGSGRQAQLLKAVQREDGDRKYYTFEYAVKRLQGEPRHDLVTVTTNRGNLYTMNISSSEKRWDKVKDLFTRVAKSFSIAE
ncbi:photosystem II oxygen evolving complex protein PsbP [Pseudanabaena sp. FACHB-1998]|uniref:photosystem II reaction center PsbP n=1 Tax=Pseudanabaena sp. FACHB-1998 TaxID=2692858 RepID=UPI0016806B2C|nr:photosystem II reaction center PsbP [Pseudanabaena sp. FACHB-1998]MBD2175395.1 photosystem II oxygen evolving complex protein PsbP [Pseudanabaena sp. FACHB-1998]